MKVHPVLLSTLCSLLPHTYYGSERVSLVLFSPPRQTPRVYI